MTTTWDADEAARKRAKFDAMCEHMRALIVHCETVGVKFGGCGDCGSAWLECATCKTNVDEAHEVFDRKPL